MSRVEENRNGGKRSCRWGENRDRKIQKARLLYSFTLHENKRRWIYVKLEKVS